MSGRLYGSTGCTHLLEPRHPLLVHLHAAGQVAQVGALECNLHSRQDNCQQCREKSEQEAGGGQFGGKWQQGIEGSCGKGRRPH